MRAKRLRRALDGWGIDRTAWIIGAVALVFYSLAATWGLPQATNPIQIRGWDVDGVAGIRVLAEFHNLLVDPKPDWYVAYPLFHYLVLAVLYAPYLAFLYLTGSFSAPSPDYPFGFGDPVRALWVMALIARCVTVVMAAATVVITYLVGRMLWDRRAGLAAALILGLASPMVYYSRTSNLDVPVLFWTVLGIVVVLHTLRDGLDMPRAVAIGVLAALAVGTKDQAYGAWIPAIAIVLGHYTWSLRHGEPDAARPRRWAPPLALLGSGIGTFAVAHGVFLRPSRFVRHVAFITNFEETFPNVLHENGLTTIHAPTVAGYLGLLGDLFRAIVTGMSPPLTIVGLAGLLILWRSRRLARVIVWMGLGFIVLALFPLHHIQYRYTLFPIWMLAVLGGGLVSVAAHVPRSLRLGAVALVVVGLLWQAGQAADLTYQMRSDARYAAGRWLDDTLAPGDSIGFFGAMHQLPHVPPGVTVVPLMGTSEAENRPPEDWTKYVIVAPDYYSDVKREHSTILPESLYEGLLDGALGYRRAAVFRTEPLTGRPPAYLPYVNPQVQVFERGSAG